MFSYSVCNMIMIQVLNVKLHYQHTFFREYLVALKRAVVLVRRGLLRLAAEAVQGAALPLQCVHHVHGSDSLPLGMLAVGNCITDDIL